MSQNVVKLVGVAINGIFTVLNDMNSSYGKGSIKAVKIDVDQSDPLNGVLKGSVERVLSTPCKTKRGSNPFTDTRRFSVTGKLSGKKAGNVTFRFLDKRQNVNSADAA